MTPGAQRLPAYHRIGNEVRARIARGELKPGDPVGSERELARAWQVSLMTARQALKRLEADGLVVRRSRVGSFVAPPRIQMNRLLGFSEQMSSRGFVARSRLLRTRATTDETEAAARLGLPRGSRLFVLERLRIAGEQPCAIETCYLPAAQFPGLIETPLDRRSLFLTLEQDYRLELAYADEEVDATSAGPRTAALLKVPRGAPVLRVRQVLYCTAARAIVYSLALYRSELYSLVIRRFR